MFSTASTWGWGLKAGPEKHDAGDGSAARPDLPGEFVSDELRNDCARFLQDLRAAIGRRHESTPEKQAGWVPRPRQ